MRDLSDRKSKTVQMAGDFGEIVKFGGSAFGRPANDDTLLRKAWIYSLFIKAKTHSHAPQPPNLD